MNDCMVAVAIAASLGATAGFFTGIWCAMRWTKEWLDKRFPQP